MTEARNNLELLSGILAIQRAGFRELDLEEIAGIAAGQIDRHLPCERSAVFLIGEEDCCVLATVGMDEAVTAGAFSVNMSVLDYLRKTGQTASAGDIGNSQLRVYVLRGGNVNSAIWTPVKLDEDIMGLLYADSTMRNAFDRDNLFVIDTLAEEISMVLQISHMRSLIGELTVKDDLTGCFNRKKFEEDLELELACAERYERVLSLLLIDIDGFRQYGDSHGQIGTALLLKELGEVLALSIRSCDKLYRYSPEEFCLILPGIDRERAFFTTRRLQAVIGKRRFMAEEEGLPSAEITVSAGIASFPADSVHKHGLIKHAEASLIEAKKNGSNSVA